MAQVILYLSPSGLGNVAVCIPTGEVPIDQVLSRVKAEGYPNAFIADETILPNADNDFFDAWELSDSTVSVNLSKAKEITRKRLRAQREPLLTAQDVLFQRALETAADTTAIVAEKQRLRDITNQVDSATTTAELRGMKVEA